MTPDGPTCEHCGASLSEVASRPRGLDREELEERIRLRRSGDNPFHRGSSDWHAADASWGGGAAFVPEPSDALARRERPATEEEPPRIDHLADAPSGAVGWSPGSSDAAPAPAAPREPPPAARDPWPARDDASRVPAMPPVDAGSPDRVAPGDRFAAAPAADERYDAGRYGDDEPYGEGGRYGDDGYGGYGADDDVRRGDDGRGGPPRNGLLAVLGFIVLGVAALLAGAVFFSILNSGPGTAVASATPTALMTPSATEASTPGESAGASPSGTAGETGGATASPTEVPSAVPPDFTAQAQPCATSDMDFHGCTQDGSTISGSKVWIWVGFRNARSSDVMGVTVLDHADGSSVGDGSIELTNIGCTPDKACTGYIQMPFSQLTTGDYDIAVSLNGQQVATSSFSVTS